MTLERALVALAVVPAAMLVGAIMLGPQQVMEACRAVNVPLGMAAAAGFFIRVNDAWARYGIGGRIVRIGVFMVLCVVAGGSAEAFITHAELGYRSMVMTIALAVTGVGLLIVPRDDPRH